ncbi:MAG: nucleotidyltransferase family protein [Elusimicrobiota bacterium]
MNKKYSDIEQIKNILKDLQGNIKKEFNAKITGVFGSYARGEHKEISDIDILVKFHKGATLFDFMGLADYLEEKLNS